MRDYHIHYYMDGCAKPEMTLPNIEEACIALGIDTLAVLKHYSAAFPNGGDDWVFWHVINKEQWETFLAEFAAYKPKKTRIYSGVETELLNEAGDINIPLCDQEKVDIVQLSVHFMPDLDCLPMDLLIYPRLDYFPETNNEQGRKTLAAWEEKCKKAGAENILQGYINAYMNAIKRFSKVKSLAHINDGLAPLRLYLTNPDSLGEKKIIEMFEPLMQLMAEKGVMWEIAEIVQNPYLLHHANNLGVNFITTSDAHQLYEGWGPIAKHKTIEDFATTLNLKMGEI